MSAEEHLHADIHTFDDARWDFHRAISSLDQAMRERGHLWIYSSDSEERTILVVNPEDSPDVPPRWRGRPVRQVRMRNMSHRGFGGSGSRRKPSGR